MKVTFDHSDKLTDTITTFWFKPEKPVEYVAGQFIEFSLQHKQVDDRGAKRWFTLSSSPTDELISITTKFADPGSSFKQALKALQPGDEIDMIEPMGDFVLPKDPTIPLVFVAGGMGITPYHSILKWLADTGEKRNIRFLYAVKTEDDIIFQDTLDAAGVRATIFVSEPSDAWGGERGHISGDKIMKVAEPPHNAYIYVSGPEPMVEVLEKDLHELSVPKHQIVLDFFPGYEPV